MVGQRLTLNFNVGKSISRFVRVCMSVNLFAKHGIRLEMVHSCMSMRQLHGGWKRLESSGGSYWLRSLQSVLCSCSRFEMEDTPMPQAVVQTQRPVPPSAPEPVRHVFRLELDKAEKFEKRADARNFIEQLLQLDYQRVASCCIGDMKVLAENRVFVSCGVFFQF